MDKRVFLSSSIPEFKNERKHISKIICQISCLECKLPEDGGPQAQNTMLSSLNEVRKSDILIGILGDCDSELTKAEITEAYNTGKYCLIYKKLKIKNKEMDRFIHESTIRDLTYAEFKGRRDLYSKITNHLKKHICDILTMGLESFQKEQRNLMQGSKKTETETKKKIEKKDYKAKDVLRQAKKSLDDGDYLSSVIMCGISLELALKDRLTKIKESPDQILQKQSIGGLIKMAQYAEIINEEDKHYMIEIRMMRNWAIHEAKIPDMLSVKTAIIWTENLVNKFET